MKVWYPKMESGLQYLTVFTHPYFQLKIDLASATFGGIPVAAPEGPVDPNQHTADTDRFDDEETFVEYELKPDGLFRLKQKPNPPDPPDALAGSAALEPDADDPPVANDERNLGARQRLFNLGFGTGLSEIISDADFKKIVSRFQKNSRLANTDGTLDDPTVAELLKQYGS